MTFKKTIRLFLIASSFLILNLEIGFAGGKKECTNRPITQVEINKASIMAAKLYSEFEKSNATVALVGRVGSDVSKYGLKYTHAGWLTKDSPKGKYNFTHLLNKCGTNQGNIYDEGLLNFFLDDPFEYRAILIIPQPELQRSLDNVLKSNFVMTALNRRYSMLAYPFNEIGRSEKGKKVDPAETPYLNSNGWALNILSKALNPEVNSIKAAQQFYFDRGYEATIIHLSGKDKFGFKSGIMRPINVTNVDHPLENKNVLFVSVESIINFMDKEAAIEKKVEITPTSIEEK